MHTEIERSTLFMGSILGSVSTVDEYHFSNSKSTSIG